MFPSGPVVQRVGWLAVVGTVYSVIAPVEGTNFAIRLPFSSVNQRFPSGPAQMPDVLLDAVIPVEYSVIVIESPEGGILANLFPELSTKLTLPSGPAAMPLGTLELVGTAYSVIVPEVVVLPMPLLPAVSVNQSSPSGPAAIESGFVPAVGVVYSVNVPDVVTFPILFVFDSVN